MSYKGDLNLKLYNFSYINYKLFDLMNQWLRMNQSYLSFQVTGAKYTNSGVFCNLYSLELHFKSLLCVFSLVYHFKYGRLLLKLLIYLIIHLNLYILYNESFGVTRT